MKKSLFLQDIYIMILSFVITALIAHLLTGVFGSILKIPQNAGKISADTVVLRGENIQYSTRELSGTDIYNILLSLKSGDMHFSSRGVDYNITEKNFSDGTQLLVLQPDIRSGRLIKIFAAALIMVFFAVYTMIALWIQKMRCDDIIKPLLELKEKTQRLSEGNLEVNIPDSGADEIRELAANIEDIRIRLKDEIYMNKKANEDRQFLISSISHDLRTPVTALSGYIQGILDGVADTDEKRRSYLEKSIEKTELINHMISDLLLYSKLDLNQVEFKMQVIDMAEYLAAVCREQEVIFKRENKHISFDLKQQTEYNVRVDVKSMDRVMGNVIENALRYTCTGSGTVCIMLRSAANSVIVEIRDNGIGIPDEDLPKIFDKFYRGEKSRKIKGSSGLGLAISKRIIENMGGRIWAKSKLGEGTSIMISLKKCKDKCGYEKNSDN